MNNSVKNPLISIVSLIKTVVIGGVFLCINSFSMEEVGGTPAQSLIRTGTDTGVKAGTFKDFKKQILIPSQHNTSISRYMEKCNEYHAYKKKSNPSAADKKKWQKFAKETVYQTNSNGITQSLTMAASCKEHEQLAKDMKNTDMVDEAESAIQISKELDTLGGKEGELKEYSKHFAPMVEALNGLFNNEDSAMRRLVMALHEEGDFMFMRDAGVQGRQLLDKGAGFKGYLQEELDIMIKHMTEALAEVDKEITREEDKQTQHMEESVKERITMDENVSDTLEQAETMAEIKTEQLESRLLGEHAEAENVLNAQPSVDYEVVTCLLDDNGGCANDEGQEIGNTLSPLLNAQNHNMAAVLRDLQEDGLTMQEIHQLRAEHHAYRKQSLINATAARGELRNAIEDVRGGMEEMLELAQSEDVTLKELYEIQAVLANQQHSLTTMRDVVTVLEQQSDNTDRGVKNANDTMAIRFDEKSGFYWQYGESEAGTDAFFEQFVPGFTDAGYN